MSLRQREEIIRKLERQIRAGDTRCNCRQGDEETFYHSAADLEKILAVPCPVHGNRSLGHVSWVPSGTPLKGEDRQLCVCPPSPAREWQEGRRGPLTGEEQEAECGNWMQEVTEEADRRFHQEQIKVRSLLQRCEQARRRQSVSVPGEDKERNFL